jgi:hypothetical protein
MASCCARVVITTGSSLRGAKSAAVTLRKPPGV